MMVYTFPAGLREWGQRSVFCMMLHSLTQEVHRINPVVYLDFPGGCVISTVLSRLKNDPFLRYICQPVSCPTVSTVFLHLNLIPRRQHFLQDSLFKEVLFPEDFLRKH